MQVFFCLGGARNSLLRFFSDRDILYPMKERRKKLLPWYLLPAIWSLAWPTMLEELMQTAVQYIDTAMVGSLGTTATAAVGATATVNWLIGTTIHALGVGFLAFISQARGAGREREARRASSQAVLVVIAAGIFFTALTLGVSPFVPVWMQADESIRALASRYFFILYTPMLLRTASIIFGTVLRAVGDTRTPMRVGVFVNLLNVALNFLLIYPTREVSFFGVSAALPGAGLGVTGAAVGSALSFALGGVLITLALWRNPEISPRGQSIRPDGEILRPCLRVAFPNALQRFGTSLGYVAFASLVNALGELSTAAHTVANTVESAFYVPGYGMQTAAATLAGNAWGARDTKKIKALSKMLLSIEIFLMILSGAALFLFAPRLLSIFSGDEDVIALGTKVLRMVALSEPFYGVSIIIEGMMQGMGKTKFPFAVNLIGMWGIRIFMTFLCTRVFGFGLVGAWGCMIAHNLSLFFVFSVHFPRLLKRQTSDS